MNNKQWKIFSDFRDDLKAQCASWNAEFGDELVPLQTEAAKSDTPAYPHETPVVYNTALDELTESSDIKLIVIGDNPGKDEQLAKNQKYLVGQSGKIAAGFFAKNPVLGIDFRKNAIILNKTPVHTAKTKHLRAVVAAGGERMARFILESQVYMAKKTAQLHKDLCAAADDDQPAANQATKPAAGPDLWLVGYSELKSKGIFVSYRDTLKASYADAPAVWEKVFVFQHFSMNRFSIDLKDFMLSEAKKNPGTASELRDAISGLGIVHRDEIFS